MDVVCSCREQTR